MFLEKKSWQEKQFQKFFCGKILLAENLFSEYFMQKNQKFILLT